MNRFIDYYKVLQVHHDAAQDVIDAAYRCLSKLYHPDLNKSLHAGDRMTTINIAYGIIGNSQKRREYHPEWIRNNVGKAAVLRAASESSTSNLRKEKDTQREKEVQKDKAAQRAKEAQREAEELKEKEMINQAYKALNNFFSETVKENWEGAYHALTDLDKGNVSLDEFVDWKKSVTKVYKLGNYKITYFKKHEQCGYAGVTLPQVVQFTVELTELQLFASQIQKELIQKYVSLENGSWKICLGFTDLKPSIKKFQYLAHALPRVDEKKLYLNAVTKVDPLTGLLNCEGFIEQAEKEMFRSQRYGNPLSLVVITVLIDEESKDTICDNQLNACVSYASQVLAENLRKTDVISRCNPSSFAILLTETQVEDAEKALGKLLDLAMGNEYLSYKLAYAASRLFKGDIAEIITATLEEVAVKDKLIDETPEIIPLKRKGGKLGKYGASDIMSFNIKGRNHF